MATQILAALATIILASTAHADGLARFRVSPVEVGPEAVEIYMDGVSIMCVPYADLETINAMEWLTLQWAFTGTAREFTARSWEYDGCTTGSYSDLSLPYAVPYLPLVEATTPPVVP